MTPNRLKVAKMQLFSYSNMAQLNMEMEKSKQAHYMMEYPWRERAYKNEIMEIIICFILYIETKS